MRILSLSMAMAIGLSACLGSDFVDSVEGNWQLSSGTLDDLALSILESHPITLTLGAGRIGGTAACNTYAGEYELSGSSLSIREGLAVTEMACQPEEAMASERAFLDAITNVETVEITNEGLVMRGPRTELRFATR